jgi:hypothetical protein
MERAGMRDDVAIIDGEARWIVVLCDGTAKWRKVYLIDTEPPALLRQNGVVRKKRSYHLTWNGERLSRSKDMRIAAKVLVKLQAMEHPANTPAERPARATSSENASVLQL